MRHIIEFKMEMVPGTSQIASIEARSRAADVPRYRIRVNNPVDGNIIETLHEAMVLVQTDYVASVLGQPVPKHPMFQQFDAPGLIAWTNNRKAEIAGTV